MNKHIKTANLSRVTWVEEQGRPLQANPVTFPTSLPSKLHLIFINLTFEQELKGSFTIFLFLVRSHILNSNGMWYS